MELPEAGIVGLGSGSTSRLFVEELAPRVKGGASSSACPPAESTRTLAASLGIPLLGDEGPWAIDVNVDGADEVSEALDLVKGGGAAHAREKIVNYAAKRNVVIVDGSKLSRRLGREVARAGRGARLRARHDARAPGGARRAGAAPKGGAPVKTDAGNLIYDLRTGPIADPGALDRALRGIPGVVETGLFVGRADVVIVAGDSGVRRLRR